MEFESLLKQRQSCRSYDSTREVEAEKLQLILEAGRLSPSARNAQAWCFYVAQGEAKRLVAEACQEANKNVFLTDAPVIVVVTLEKNDLVGTLANVVMKDFRPYDAGMAIANMTMQAKALGIDSCIIGWINEAKMRKALAIDKKTQIGLAVCFGYAPSGYETRQKVRKEPDKVIKFL